MRMMIYLYVGAYGDGIVLLNPQTVSENIFNLYQNLSDFEYIGKQDFSEKILRKLDKQKTLDSHGEINLSYIE